MHAVVYIRDGFPLNKRRRRLTTISNLDRTYAHMDQGSCMFDISLEEANDHPDDIQCGRMVEVVDSGFYTQGSLTNNDGTTKLSKASFAVVAREYGQGFRVPAKATFSLTAVTLALSKLGSPTGNIRVELRSNDGVNLPGAIIATSAVLDVTTLTTSEAWYTFTFPTAIILRPGTTYHITDDISGLTFNNATNCFVWYNTFLASFGVPTQSLDGGTVWTVLSNAMKMYFTAIAVGGGTVCPLIPEWLGFIDNLEWNVDPGKVTVRCIDLNTKLKDRVTGLSSPVSGAAGSIVRDLLYQSNSRNPWGLQWALNSEVGTRVTDLSLSAESLYDAINDLADRSDEEWWIEQRVSPTRVDLELVWGRKRGSDKSASVCLIEGVHFSNIKYTQDALESTASVVVVGGGNAVGDRTAIGRTTSLATPSGTGARVEVASVGFQRGASLAPILANEKVVVLPKDASLATLSTMAQRALEIPVSTSEELTVTLNSKVDWSLIGLGDIYRIKLASVGSSGVDRKARVWALQPDEATGEMDVKLEVATT